MSLAATAGAGQDQPTGRLVGESQGVLKCLLEQVAAGGVGQRTVRTGGGEGDPAQRPEIAVSEQGVNAGCWILGSLAITRESLSEVGVSDRNALADPTGPVADGANRTFRLAI